jgi:phenylacetic acid degradation protein paaN
VLSRAGLSPDLVSLAVEAPGERLAGLLAARPEVRVVDFTGGTDFGDWLEANATQAAVYTEKSGLNAVVVDGTDDYAGLLRNLAVSLSLYSGQLCTTPRNIFVPRDGIGTDQGPKSFEEFAADLGAAIDRLLAEPRRAVEVLGAISDPRLIQRLDEAHRVGRTVLASRTVPHPTALVRTPVVVALDASDGSIYGTEWFGPVSFLIATGSTGHSLRAVRDSVTAHGALTMLLYSVDPAVLEAAGRAALDAGVNLSVNLTGPVYVNQSVAFSDLHGTGANPSASAALTDPGFIAGRFHLVQTRRQVPPDDRPAAA